MRGTVVTFLPALCLSLVLTVGSLVCEAKSAAVAADGAFLPAIQTPEERAASQDAEQIIPGSDPDRTITPPPSGPVRRAGEYEPVETVLLSYMGSLDELYGDILAATWQEAHVRVLVYDAAARDSLREILRARHIPARAIEILTIDFNSVWMRDYGPVAVLTAGGVSYIDTRYYRTRRDDDEVPTHLAALDNVAVYRPDVFIEGGNFFANGEGICFISDYVLAENPNYTAADLQGIFRAYHGCDELHILPALVGNVIGHVDMYMYIANPHTILLGQYEPSEDLENAQLLEDVNTYLSGLKTRSGIPFRTIRVPMPAHIQKPLPTRRLPVVRTYLNGVAVNNAVLVPVYFQEPDKEALALERWQTAFPERTIVPIPADRIAPQFGTIHCIIQTIPVVPH